MNGENASELYKFLKSEAPKAEENAESEGLYQLLKEKGFQTSGGEIKWNFTKFLVDRTGKVVSRYAPTFAPEKLEAAIEALL